MDPIKVELTIDGFDEASIISEVCTGIKAEIRPLIHKRLWKEVEKAIQECIKVQAETAVEVWLSKPIQKTNSYGEPSGKKQSISEYLIDQFELHMKTMVDYQGRTDSYSEKKNQTRLQWLISKITSDGLEKKVSETIKEAREASEAGLKAAIAELVAKHMK